MSEKSKRVVKAHRRHEIKPLPVPESSSPFLFIPGKNGGWFIALTWNHGSSVDVTWRQLRQLLASSKGDVVIARRLTGDQLRLLEQYLHDIGCEAHASLIFKDSMRWARSKRR